MDFACNGSARLNCYKFVTVWLPNYCEFFYTPDEISDIIGVRKFDKGEGKV